MATGAPIPVREYATVAEMQRHAAEVRARMFAPRPAPEPRHTPARIVPAGREIYRGDEIVPEKVPFVLPPVELPATAAQRENNAELRGQDCLRIVARVTGITQTALKSERRLQPIVRARQIAAWLLVNRAGKSLPEAGRFLGGRDHTTALHACRRVDTTLAAFGISPDMDAEALATLLHSVTWPLHKTTKARPCA